MKKQTIYIIIELTLLVLAILFMALSKVAPVLLIIGLGMATIFFIGLSILAVLSYRRANREHRNELAASMLQETQFDDVEIENKKTKYHNDRLSLVIFSIVATIVCLYMFIYLLI